MKLISLDPSSTHTGFAAWAVGEDWSVPILVHRETITCDGDDPIERRNDMARQVVEVCYLCGAECVVLERDPPLNYGRKVDPRTIAVYRNAVTTIVNALIREYGAEKVYGVYPQTWKASAKKKDTIRMVNERFGLNLKMKDEHVADAIGVGLWFVDRMARNPIEPIGRCTL